MKYRISRLVDGDRNTTFYHTFILNRGKDIILSITDSLGNWLTDENEVANVINSRFGNPYTTYMVSS